MKCGLWEGPWVGLHMRKKQEMQEIGLAVGGPHIFRGGVWVGPTYKVGVIFRPSNIYGTINMGPTHKVGVIWVRPP